jgi:predicted nucleic acid-binding protein
VILIHSRDLRSEAGRILADKFHWSQDEIRLACDVYWNTGVPVTPQAVIQACRDPDDNRVLECAVEGHAQYIVTGDRDLLKMEKFRGCEILSPADFLLRKGV